MAARWIENIAKEATQRGVALEKQQREYEAALLKAPALWESLKDQVQADVKEFMVLVPDQQCRVVIQLNRQGQEFLVSMSRDQSKTLRVSLDKTIISYSYTGGSGTSVPPPGTLDIIVKDDNAVLKRNGEILGGLEEASRLLIEPILVQCNQG